ncbi:phosphonate C-P lyase system protein PhnL [Azoarcus sp. L1K30]|uniref:phosphonate C-P lyase system protein PhnL n=1 Tax=Azoarcus sp. L1K30 TaxID=2820277 RepID=UPI001B82AA2F|nr:phosphonate C-P lyase system protein PhnL [Azoarcus sp. L1K30]MBR0568209.1 phosphonate C-P lyase system protein PhnL [Azoarcus sp. L1K30]
MQDIHQLKVEHLSKHFILHNQGGVRMAVIDDISFDLGRGECLVLDGPSGAGKSTLLRCLYANYLASSGAIRVRAAGSGECIDMVGATPQAIIELRRTTLSYVSQFLRVIPRVGALDVIAEPLLALGESRAAAMARAAALLTRLNLPERLWQLPPATFSGGEQQRVNIARGFIAEKPVLLLDEPTASLDAANRQVVIALIREACARGAAVVGIFHDGEVSEAVATRRLPVLPLTPLAA